MGSNWNEDILKNLCIGIFSGGTPLTTKKEYWDGDIHWLSSGETRSRYIVKTEKTITQAGVDNSSTRKALTGDIVVASAGQGLTRGQVSFCLIDTYINQSLIAIRTKVENISPLFLYYSLLSRYEELRSVSDASSTRGSLTCRIIESLPLRYPAYESQIIIAAILSAYDDLIENNLRRIKILEEMAQNLYREWFVNFRFPGHENTRFVDSPLGQIPEGWEVKKLKDVLELKYGKALKKADRLGGDVPVYGSSGVVGFHNNYLVQGPGIIVGRKGNVGSIFWSDENFYPIDTAYFVSSMLPLRFLYYELQNKNFINNDAAVPGLNRNQAYSLELVVPTDDVLPKFCRIVDNIERQASILKKKNDILCQTRDFLLPKLISGELDISDIEIEMPEEVSA